MVKAKILVTGAGGKTGFAVVSRLREEDWPVRALVRTNDDRRAALDHQQGAFEFGAPNSVVLDVTGKPAEDLEVTARRYAALPQARRTFGRVARAWLGFVLTPFFPGHDLAAYEQSLGIARPAKACFAMDNDAWRSERGGAAEHRLPARRPTDARLHPIQGDATHGG